MKLATLKSLERGAWRKMKTLEAAAKEAPRDAELAALSKAAEKDWGLWHERWSREAAVAAERADKGEVLFTIFYPDHSSLRSVIRTPRRFIRRCETKPWYRDEMPKDHVEVRGQSGVMWEFQYHMRDAREQCERAGR